MLTLTRTGALAAAATLAPCLAFAHHPGGTGNSSGAGPAITIPATTIEEGHIAAFVAYEYIRLRGIDDQDLMAAAGRHQHVHSMKTIASTSFGLAYGITDDLTVSLRLPYVERTDIREGTHSHVAGGAALNGVTRRGDTAGLGDATVMGQWRFFNNRATGTEAAVLFGMKLPTGDTHQRDVAGERFETEFQPGSGSSDPFIGLAGTQRFGAWSFDANVVYVFVRPRGQLLRESIMRALRTLSLALTLLLPAPAVLGHGELVDASPKPGSVIAAPPAAVRIQFSEGIEARFSGLTVTAPDGKRVATGRPEVQGAVIAVPLPRSLPPGLYRVNWRVLSDDSHKTQGTFTFEVRP